jgi:type I restriction enzyme S subunit
MNTIIPHNTQYKNSPLGLIPEDWEVKTVAEAFEICNNLRLPISEDERKKIKGDYPYYGPTKIQDYINEYRVNGKYALIGEDGDHFLKWKELPMTLLIDGKFNVNNHAHLIQGKENLTEWFFYYFNNKELTPHLTRQGAGRYKLTKKALGEMLCPLPFFNEQKAIVDCLSTWDKAIEKHNALIAQKELSKKALMQQLLSGKKRLKGFEKKWSFIRFSEIYSQIKEKAGDKKFMVLSVTKAGIVSQAEYFNKEIASDDTSPYLVMKKGDMVLSGLNFWMGSIDVLTEYESGMVSPAYKVFEIFNKNISSEFMKYYVRSNIMLQALIGSSVIGASVVRRNMDRETLEEWSFHLPDYKEQTAIANVLQCTDTEIKLLKNKLTQLKEQKKGLMQVLLTGKKRLKI